MTEEQWSASTNPEAMLELLGGEFSPRKLRHFLVGCRAEASESGSCSDLTQNRVPEPSIRRKSRAGDRIRTDDVQLGKTVKTSAEKYRNPCCINSLQHSTPVCKVSRWLAKTREKSVIFRACAEDCGRTPFIPIYSTFFDVLYPFSPAW
jgi:hypothetical protein